MKLIQLFLNKLKKPDNLALIILLTAASSLYLINLSINGYANNYYAAAVQAASTSWKAFFFGSLDSANFISIDKPPMAIWLMAISVRLFGFSSFAMLLPNAIAGVITLWLVFSLVKKKFGLKSAIISDIIMLLTPVAALMFRFNNPDSILTIFLTASSYTFLKSLDSKKPLLHLALTGIFTGFAFNTKMLQGLILLPIMFLVYLFFAKQKKSKRVLHLFLTFLVTSISCLWWPTIVWLTPASSRPYIGSSSNNSIWNLIIKYNGLNRLFGESQKINPLNNNLKQGINPNKNNMVNPEENGFGGQAGVFRMFNSDFGPNIGWLIPLAITCSIIALAKFKAKKTPTILFLFSWLLIHIIIFSVTKGTIHPYYTVVMAPAIAALIGIGLPYIWKILPIPVILTAYTSYTILNYSKYYPQLKNIVTISAIISIILFFIHFLKKIKKIKLMAMFSAFFCFLLAPAIYTFSTVIIPHAGNTPTAGPNFTARITDNELIKTDPNLISYLLNNRDNTTWIIAVSSANELAPIQISTKLPVMAIGGFSGGDDSITLEKFKKIISNGQLKYFLISDNRRMGGPGNVNNVITSWVRINGKPVDYGGNAGTLYLLKI